MKADTIEDSVLLTCKADQEEKSIWFQDLLSNGKGLPLHIAVKSHCQKYRAQLLHGSEESVESKRIVS